MTYEMQYLMHLYYCGALGIEASPPEKTVNWEKIVTLAVEQSITYTIAMAIKKSELTCPDEIKQRLITSARGAALKNSIKTDGILSLVEKMNTYGINAIVLKGIDVARFYANPECRLSSDTDLLIIPSDEKKAVNFFKNNQFEIRERHEDSNHTVCVHNSLGIFELHTSLLPKMFTNSMFSNWNIDNDAFSTCNEVDYQGKRYKALNATNSLLFLTYHMIKHFLYSGMSLRMIMDNALYSKYNIESIDKEKYKSFLKDTKYFYTTQLIFGAAIKYFGFKKDDFPIEPIIDDDKINEIIDDLEIGGWQGTKEEQERIDAWLYYRYKNALSTKNPKDLKDINKQYRDSFFPPLKALKKTYPILIKHGYLYPFFVVHRLLTKGVNFAFVKKKKIKLKTESVEDLPTIAKKRIEMFKKLEIL